MGISLASLPMHVQDQVRAKLAAEERAQALAAPATLDDGARHEHDLQSACEAWLERRGYGRRVPKRMQRHSTGRWFLHFPQAKGNPLVLDLLLLDSQSNRYLEVELKADGGRLSPDQNALIVRREGVVCWSEQQFRDAVLLWERASDYR